MGSNQSTAATASSHRSGFGEFVQDSAGTRLLTEDDLRRVFLVGPLTTEQQKLYEQGLITQVPTFNKGPSGKMVPAGTIYKSLATAARIAQNVEAESGRKLTTGGRDSAPLVLGGSYWRVARGGTREGGASESLAMVKTLDLGRMTDNKKKLVDDLLRVFSSTDYKALKAISGTPEERLRQIGKFVAANPVANGESVCKQFANAINKVFGVQVIDASLPATECAKQMEELLDSFSHGVAADFYLIGMDIYRDVKNIAKLLVALKTWKAAAEERQAKSGTTMENAGLFATLGTIIDEFERYTGLMTAALRMHFEPTLSGILAKTEYDRASSARLSDRVENILRGIHSTASMALAVQMALDKIGMKPDEFKNLKSANEFWMKFAQIVDVAKIEGSENPDELFEAGRLIAQNLGNAPQLAAAMEGARVGRGVSGGAPAPTVENLAVEKLKARKSHARIILNAYGLAIQGGIRKIRVAIDDFASVIGTDIPLGGLLDNFRDLLRQLAEIKLEIPKIHLALLGYYKDAASKEVRDRMLGTLKSVAEYATFIAKDAQYARSKHYFEAIKSSVDDLISAIDQAADSIHASVIGGAEGGVDGGDESPMVEIRELVVRDKLRLVDSIEKADYMVRVAQIKSNLAHMVSEFKTDTKSYETKVLGPAVAERLNKLQIAEKYVLGRLDAAVAQQGATFEPSAGPAVQQNSADEAYDYLHAADQNPTRKTAAKKFVQDYYKALTGFWESAQAIELYLKYFTNALITEPGAVRDIAMMIREVEVIAEMYNEKAGDSIAQIFEANFPSDKDLGSDMLPGNGGAGDRPTPVGVAEGKSAYEWTGRGAMPFTQVLKGRLEKMIGDTTQSLGQYLALKNLVSFFIHFGSQLGGTELRRMALRTPGEIYIGLVRFMAVSSFAMGFKRNLDTAAAANVTALTYDRTSGKFGAESGAADPARIADGGARAMRKPALAVAGVALPPGGSTDAQAQFGCGINAHLSDSIFMRPYQMRLQGSTQHVAFAAGYDASASINVFDDESRLDLEVENQAFAAIVKALGAKMLVLSGMYDLIDRPHEMHESRVAVRMILGAGPEESFPKVEEAATELYVRLPLFALFYKNRFTSDKTMGRYMKDDAKVVVLPDLSGSVFSEFISLIFRKFPHADTQFFTDNEMRILIAEINQIYHKLASKYPQDTCRSILGEFAQTMSRMIYIIGKDDQDKYAKQIAFDTSFRNSATMDVREQIDILGDEGLEDDMIKRQLPSDQAILEGHPIPERPSTGEFVVKAEHWDLIRKFRCMIERQISSSATFSLRGSIVATQVKLGQAAADSDRFRLVCGLVRGTGGSTMIDSMRQMIFLEVMGTGLGILSAIYTIIRQLQIVSVVTNPKAVFSVLEKCPNAGDTNASLTAIAKQIAIELNLGGDADSESLIRKALIIAMGYDGADCRHMTDRLTSAAHTMTINSVGHEFDFLQRPLNFTTEPNKTAIMQNILYHPHAMTMLLESVATAMSTTNGFVRADIASGELLVDCGALQEHVKKSLSALTKFVDAMRPHIEPEMIERFTAKMTAGSLYWLQEQFVEKLFEGRFETAGTQKYSTIPKMQASIREGFETLLKPITHDIDGRPAAEFRVDFTGAMANVIAYNSTTEDGITPGGADLFRSADILANPFDALLVRGSAKEKTVDTRFLCSLALSDEQHAYNDPHNSILFAFNKLLAMFLRQVYDTSSGKVFSGLIDTFAQGAFNNAILSEKNTYPDHLASYFVENMGGRKVYAPAEAPIVGYPGTLGAYFDALDAFSKGAHHGAFGFGNDGTVAPFAGGPGSGNLPVQYAQGGVVQQIHRFVASLMLSWFARNSQMIDASGSFVSTQTPGLAIMAGAWDVSDYGSAIGVVNPTIAHTERLTGLVGTTMMDTLNKLALGLTFENDFSNPADQNLTAIHALVALVNDQAGAGNMSDGTTAFNAAAASPFLKAFKKLSITAFGNDDETIVRRSARAFHYQGALLTNDNRNDVSILLRNYCQAVAHLIRQGTPAEVIAQCPKCNGLVAFGLLEHAVGLNGATFGPAGTNADSPRDMLIRAAMRDAPSKQMFNAQSFRNRITNPDVSISTDLLFEPRAGGPTADTMAARRPIVTAVRDACRALSQESACVVARGWVSGGAIVPKVGAGLFRSVASMEASTYMGDPQARRAESWLDVQPTTILSISPINAGTWRAFNTGFPNMAAINAGSTAFIDRAYAIRQGLMTIEGQIATVGRPSKSDMLIDVIAFLSNAYGGIYEDRLARGIAQTLSSDVMRSHPWVSLIAYPSENLDAETPTSQIAVRSGILNAMMEDMQTHALGVPAAGVQYAGQAKLLMVGTNVFFDRAGGRDGGSRSAECLALYTALMTSLHQEDGHINALAIAAALAGRADGGNLYSQFVGRFDRATSGIVQPASFTGQGGQTVAVLGDCNADAARVLGHHAVYHPVIARAFANFFVGAVDGARRNTTMGNFFSAEFLASAPAQQLIGKLPTIGALDQPTTERLLRQLMNGGLIFDKTGREINDINCVAYKTALAAPFWLKPQWTTQFASGGETLPSEQTRVMYNMVLVQVQHIYAEADRMARGVNDAASLKILVDYLYSTIHSFPIMNNHDNVMSFQFANWELARVVLMSISLADNDGGTNLREFEAVIRRIGAMGDIPAAIQAVAGDAQVQANPTLKADAASHVLAMLLVPIADGGLSDAAWGDVLIAEIRRVYGLGSIMARDADFRVAAARRDDSMIMNDVAAEIAAIHMAPPATIDAGQDPPAAPTRDQLLRTLMRTNEFVKEALQVGADYIVLPPGRRHGPVTYDIGTISIASRDVMIGSASVSIPLDDATDIPAGGAPAGIAPLLACRTMVAHIRQVHDIFLQLNMLADIHRAWTLTKDANVAHANIERYMGYLVANTIPDIEIAPNRAIAWTSALKRTDPTILKNYIFDGYLPKSSVVLQDYRRPSMVIASMVTHGVGSSQSKKASDILAARRGFDLSGGLADYVRRLDAGEPDAPEGFWAQIGSKPFAPSGLPEEPVVALNVQAKGQPIVRHIIPLSDYQRAIIDDRAEGEGAFIVYPGRAGGQTFQLVSDYHLKLHGKPLGAVQGDYANKEHFERRFIPDGNHVLFASIGHILNNLITSTDERTQMRVHLQESAADIPSYLRDKYRAILPFFRAAFHSLATKCDFYKRVMEQTSVEGFRKPAAADGAAYQHAKDLSRVGYEFIGAMNDKLTGILKTIATGASALVQDCTRTLTDVADKPRYFEVSSDSINAFRSQNGGDPIMPLSALVRVARTHATGVILDEMQPKFGFGDPAFKYQYAIRGLYHPMSTGKEAPNALQGLAALESMVSLFNKFSHGGIKIDAGLAQDLAQTITAGFDFIHDVERVKFYTTVRLGQDIGAAQGALLPMHEQILAPSRDSSVMKNRAIRILTEKPTAAREVVTSFGLQAPDISNVVNVVENRNREDAIKQVLFGTLGNADQRGDAIIANIVDMNIMPFDLHVLARQMPLHFIWNYAFTFDSIVGTMLYDRMSPSRVMDTYFHGCRKNAAGEDVEEPSKISSARDALFAMLTDPYRALTHEEKGWVDRMLVGATGVPGFERPKFLSDQLAGKILLANVMSTAAPGVGPPSTSLGFGNHPTLATQGNASDVAEERATHGAVLTEFLRLIHARGITTTSVMVNRAAAVLAVARPTTSMVVTNEQFRALVAIRIHNITHPDAERILQTMAAAAIATMSMNPSAKAIAEEYDTVFNEFGRRRDIAAVVLVTRKVNSVRNLTPAACPEIGEIPADVRSIWMDLIARWNFPKDANIANSDASGGSHQVNVNAPGAINSMAHNADYLHTPMTDEYGLTTFARDNSVGPKTTIIHDMRVDTLLARNLMHISLVLAVVQMRLHGDITYMHDQRVADAMGALNPSIYKFFGFQSAADGKKYTPSRVTKKFI